MKKLLVLAALIALAVPATYAAASSKEEPANSEAQSQSSDASAAKACKAERASLAVDAFNKKYGTNHNLNNAFGKCVSGKSKGKEGAEDNTQGKDDDEKGQNEAKDEDEQGQNDQGQDNDQNTSAAAKQCKKELAGMGAAAFANKYGTNNNKHNAFGKCASSKSKSSKSKENDKSDND